MLPVGKLIVFEGPDGVGKSTLVKRTEELLKDHQVQFESLSFPGKNPGSLGWLVDRIHHERQQFQLDALTPLSLQALHIAAHLDHIETRILPRLTQGTWIVLDRFWWSTWVYGHADDVNAEVLEKLIDAEKIAWSATAPAASFLINRTTAFRPEHTQGTFVRLSTLYTQLANRERQRHPVVSISNDSLDESLETIRNTIADLLLSTTPSGKLPDPR